MGLGHDELTNYKNDLAKWAKAKGDGFFLKTDSDAMAKMLQISTALSRPPTTFPPDAVTAFMSDADAFLIAYSLAYGHVIVTQEVPNKLKQLRPIKLPTACKMLGVRCINLFDALREIGAKFVLPSS